MQKGIKGAIHTAAVKQLPQLVSGDAKLLLSG